MCKAEMRRMRLVHIKTIKHLYIVEPKKNFICMKYWDYVVSTSNNPELHSIIEKQSIDKHWGNIENDS